MHVSDSSETLLKIDWSVPITGFCTVRAGRFQFALRGVRSSVGFVGKLRHDTSGSSERSASCHHGSIDHCLGPYLGSFICPIQRSLSLPGGYLSSIAPFHALPRPCHTRSLEQQSRLVVLFSLSAQTVTGSESCTLSGPLAKSCT